MSEEKKPVVPETDTEQELAKKRNAFLRYMTIVFAVAFLLVLISLVLQAHTARAAMSDLKESNSSALTNAAANAELLQDENRRLQEEVDSLKAQLAEQNGQSDALEEAQSELERVEKERDALKEKDEVLAEVYDALIVAMQCTTHEGNVTFSKAISTVEKYKEYLSDEALSVYEGLLTEE